MSALHRELEHERPEIPAGKVARLQRALHLRKREKFKKCCIGAMTPEVKHFITEVLRVR